MEREEVQDMIDNALKVHVYEQHKNRGNVFQPPTLDEVRQYAEEKGLRLNCEKFWEFYESKGWMVGKVKMRNWHVAAQAAVREGWGKAAISSPTAKVKILCACGCGQESTVEVEGKRWAMYACYGRWLKDLQARAGGGEPRPVKPLPKASIKLDGEPVRADFEKDEQLRGGT